MRRRNRQSELFGGRFDARAIADAGGRAVAARRRLQREFDAIGFFLSGHPLDDYKSMLEKCAVQPWAEFLQCGEAGADRRPRRRHRGGARRAAHQDRQQDGHPGILRSLRHYEAVIFQEGLMQYRDLLEPARRCC
jgi:DNA polymerase-3 subunit alpha